MCFIYVHMYLFAVLCHTLFSHSPFPTVADSVQGELEEYKQSEGEVTRLKTAMVSKTLLLMLQGISFEFLMPED